MSHDSIDQAFIVDWHDGLQLKAQQTQSRLQATVMPKGTVTGESFTHNHMGDTELDPNINRLADTVWGSVLHKTPVAQMNDFYKALPLDRADIPKMKINPVSGGEYMGTLFAARNRRFDKTIYNALIGTQGFKDGSTEVLPAAQKILHSGQGMTKGKIILAKKFFRGNEADEHAGEELFMLYDDNMLEDILADTTLTSVDHMAVKMLQEGDISGKWCGFKWVPYNALNSDGSAVTTTAYAKSACKFGTGYVDGNATQRGDKQDAWQVSMACSMGALRTEDVRVVSIEFQQ